MQVASQISLVVIVTMLMLPSLFSHISLQPVQAEDARLYVSAAGIGDKFFGPQIVQVTVEGPGIREQDTSPGALVVNGVNVPLVHLTDSRWVAFVADQDTFTSLAGSVNIPGNEVSVSGGSFWALGPNGRSGLFPSLSGAVSNDPGNSRVNPNLDLTGDCPAVVTDNDPCVEWPYIRFFSFSENDRVSFRYSSQSVTLNYIKQSSDDVSITLDRDSYPIGAEIILTLSDSMWNINPVEEDHVHFAFTGSSSAVFYQPSSTIAPSEVTGIMSSIGFDRKQALALDGVDAIKFVNTISGTPETILIETGPNSGVFENYESRADMTASKRDVQFRFDYFDRSTASGMGSSDAHLDVGKEEPKVNKPVSEQQSEKPVVNVNPYSMSEPMLSGLLGGSITGLAVDEPLLVKTNVTNNLNEDQPFTYIVQVKDSEGITEMLTWIKGTMNASSSLGPGISWTPEKTGKYTIEVFVWKSLDDPGLTLTKSISVDVE